MKSLKRIITLICIMISALVGVTACDEEDLYNYMVVSCTPVSGITQDVDGEYYVTYDSTATGEGANTFVVDFVVSNLTEELNSSLTITMSGDSASVRLLNSEVLGFTTRVSYLLVGGGTIEIRAISNENSDKFATIKLNIVVPIKDLQMVGQNSIVPVVRGASTNLSIGTDYITYSPANTSQRDISIAASLISGFNYADSVTAQNEITAINNAMANGYSTITVPSNSTISTFAIRVTSVYNSSIYADAIVRVLDMPDVDEIQLTVPQDNDGLHDYKMLTQDLDTGKYTLTLSYDSGSDEYSYNDYTTALIDMYYGMDIIDGSARFGKIRLVIRNILPVQFATCIIIGDGALYSCACDTLPGKGTAVGSHQGTAAQCEVISYCDRCGS